MGILRQNIKISDYSNFRIGGYAKYFAEVNSLEDIKKAIHEYRSKENNLKNIIVIGSGTNILFSDQGINGLVLYNNIKFQKHIIRNQYEFGSGNLVSEILDFCIKNAFSGLEWAGGLPGTIGGAVRGNAGAFGGQTDDIVVCVKSYNLFNGVENYREKAQCNFGYRNSFYKNPDNQEIIISVILDFSDGNAETIKKSTLEKINYRRKMHPLEYPNVGSIFKNVKLTDLPKKWQLEFKDNIKNDPFPVIAVARLITLCNLKGKRIGGAIISEKHPNYIVNIDHATSKDVMDLIALVKQNIKDKFNVILEEEIVYQN